MTRLLLCLGLLAGAAAARAAAPRTGFLVLAPDRGFLGNEETREAFESYRAPFAAELAIVGTREDEPVLREALSALAKRGAEEIVALPLFVSESHPALRRAKERLSDLAGPSPPLLVAPVYGAHPYAREALADRISTLSRDPAKEALLLVAQGADGPDNARKMEEDLLRAGEALAGRLPFARREAVVLEGWDPLRDFSGRSDVRLRDSLSRLRADGLTPVMVPFDLTVKMDSMMRLATRLGALSGRFGAVFNGDDLTPHPALALWLARESNGRSPISEKDLGVVFMPHGADEAWNRAMLRAAAPLAARVRLEPAFGMADPVLIERAVRRLEARGARAVAVLRVYSLDSSFRAPTDCALSLGCQAPRSHSGHSASGHGHAEIAPHPILSPSAFVDVGGIGDSPLFARALFERARALSRTPAKETVFLVGHGAGEDAEDLRWRRMLESLARQVAALAADSGRPFLSVRGATLREDWPDKRGPAVEALRAELAAAKASGGVIVVPARTAEGGPERELLSGLDFAYAGESFAPSPYFLKWMESQIAEALTRFESQRLSGLAPIPSRGSTAGR